MCMRVVVWKLSRVKKEFHVFGLNTLHAHCLSSIICKYKVHEKGLIRKVLRERDLPKFL